MESHLVRIINRLEMMAADGGNLKRNFEREGVVVAEVSFSNDPENGPVFTLRDVEARESYSFDSHRLDCNGNLRFALLINYFGTLQDSKNQNA